MSDPLLQALISSISVIIGGLLTVVFVSRKQANADLKRGSADATQTLQQVISDMGDVYGQLVKDVRETVEAQIRTEYEERLEQLDRRVRTLENERSEWQLGIGILLTQLSKLKIEPEWKPRISNSGRLQPKDTA
jgi:chaperonin cofactor prefoldin